MSNQEIRLALLRGGGAIRTRDHRDLRHRIYRLTDDGVLVTPHPGVFVAATDLVNIEVRLRAAALWRPEAVVTGRGAARLTFWPDLAVPEVQLAVPGGFRARAGVQQIRRVVPPEWRMRFKGVMITRPALTTMDLVPDLDGAAISTALRCGVAMDDLHLALASTSGRRFNRHRLRLLRSYRDLPWSEAEQQVHLLLRGARLKGWMANYAIRIDGHRRYLDIVFEEQRLFIEIDGYEFHGLRVETRNRFEDDRFVADELVRRRWRVLRFTWLQITQKPDWVVACIRDVLGQDRCGCRRMNRAADGRFAPSRAASG